MRAADLGYAPRFQAFFVAWSWFRQNVFSRPSEFDEWVDEYRLLSRLREDAERLVEQEDLLTLRKAKAIYLLKQRNGLPDELADLLH